MKTEISVYFVHQTIWPMILGLVLGWTVVVVGSFRWGLRFAAVALPFGLLIPASQFLAEPGLLHGLLDPETAAWNAAYWLLPASVLVALTLAFKRSRRKVH